MQLNVMLSNATTRVVGAVSRLSHASPFGRHSAQLAQEALQHARADQIFYNQYVEERISEIRS